MMQDETAEHELEAHAFLAKHGFDPGVLDGTSFFDPERFVNQHRVRDAYIQRFGFAVPTMEALAAIAEHEPILEVGAGAGYWAHELEQRGVDIIATDPKTGRYNHASEGGGHWDQTFTEVVEVGGQEAIELYPNRALLIIWPDYGEPWPADVLEAYPGDVVCYVGEGPMGCTADERFHKLLGDRYEQAGVVDLPQFEGIHDHLQIWTR